MLYSSKRNKLKYEQDKTKEINYNISQQQTNEESLNSQLRLLQPTTHIFKRIRNQSTEWENMSLPIVNEEIYTIHLQFINWSIVWEKLDIRLIPFFDVKILIRNGEENNNYEWEAIPRSASIFEITDIEGESNNNIKYVTLHATTHMSSSILETQYQAKLAVFFNNPRQY